MSIDWITVAAQIANFLLLVWLLKRFLYRPILDGIDAREKEIAERMAEAGIAKQQAKKAEAEFRQQQAELLDSRQNLVDEALKATAAERQQVLTAARSKLEQEQQDWQNHLANERKKFIGKLHLAASQTLLELTRKALHDLADAELEESLVRHVSQRLTPLVEELAEASGDSTTALATTREPLPEAAQARLRTDLKQLLPNLELNFAIEAEQAPGLILRVGGAQVEWTVDSYIDELDNLLNERHELSY
ncbi:MAG: F0F1 ATP synthase subunit delta [Thiohalomonadaceae bacterium]